MLELCNSLEELVLPTNRNCGRAFHEAIFVPTKSNAMKTLSNQFRIDSIKTMLILLITFSSLNISAQYFEWAKQFGGPTGDQPHSMAYDANGNLYMTGLFTGTADFDPGSGSFYLTSNGGTDIFVVKLNSSGDLIWAKSVGGSGGPVPGTSAEDKAYSISVGPSGNVYVCGHFSGTVDFNPGLGTFNMTSAPNNEGLTCASHPDAFVLKLNASGSFVWAKQIGGSGFDDAYSLALGASESVHIVGRYQSISCSTDVVDLDPGIGTYYAAGGGGSYLIKLDSGGAFAWADVFPEWSTCSSPCGVKKMDIRIGTVHLDASGNIYCGGSFVATADFDPGAGTYFLTPDFGPNPNQNNPNWENNGYVLKLNSSGGFVWAKPLSGGTASIADVDVDGNGNVFSTGNFLGMVDFNPGPGKKNLTSIGNGDILVWKLKSSGTYAWAGQMGTGGIAGANSIDLDGDGNVYTGGSLLSPYNNGADFNPAKSKYLLYSAGNYDAFVSKLTNSGAFVWAVRMGGVELDVGTHVMVNGSDEVFTCGYFAGTADFDPGSGTYNMTAFGDLGKTDAFLQKMNQSGGGKWGGAQGEVTHDFTLFPNPTTGEVSLASEEELSNATLRVFNVAGQLVLELKDVSGSSCTLDLLGNSAGLYFIEVSNGGTVTRLKLLKQ